MVVIADMQAGLEHLSWAGGTLRHVDALLVVTGPTAKQRLTAARTLALAAQLGIAETGVVGNTARNGDREPLARFAAAGRSRLVALVPEDPAVVAADRAGRSLFDAAPDSPAARALKGLADDLERRYIGAGA